MLEAEPTDQKWPSFRPNNVIDISKTKRDVAVVTITRVRRYRM